MPHTAVKIARREAANGLHLSLVKELSGLEPALELEEALTIKETYETDAMKIVVGIHEALGHVYIVYPPIGEPVLLQPFI